MGVKMRMAKGVNLKIESTGIKGIEKAIGETAAASKKRVRKARSNLEKGKVYVDF